MWNDQCTQSDCGAGGGGMSSLWSRPTLAGRPRHQHDHRHDAHGSRPLGDGRSRRPGSSSTTRGPAQGSVATPARADGAAIGGTSIGAPLVSALIAVGRAELRHVPRLGFVNPSLYAMASTGYVDVTTGNNDLYNIGEYSAGAGLRHGLGSGQP